MSTKPVTTNPDLAQTESPVRNETSAAGEYRLLIVDDTAGIHDDFRKILREEESQEYDAAEAALFGSNTNSPAKKKFRIDSAYQGQEALELVQKAVKAGDPYTLAFVDVRMPPGWDGIETVKRLWEVDPHLQVVICTAYSDYSWNEMTGSLGQTDNLVFLKKPFETIEILQLVYSLTTKATLASESRRRVEALDQLVSKRTSELQVANQELVADIAMRKSTEHRLSLFTALGKRLSEAKNPREAAEIIVEVANDLLGWDACACDLYSQGEDCLIHLLDEHFVTTADPAQNGKCACHKLTDVARKTILEGGQLILAENNCSTTVNGQGGHKENADAASILSVPIRNGSFVIGVLSIKSRKQHAYDQQSLATLQALADHCGGAFNRLKSEEDLRLTEQQLRHSQKMEAIGLLAGGIAHDFNNLLAVILGNAELVLEDTTQCPADTSTCVKEIASAAHKAANLTRQLLAFSRKGVVNAQTINLNQHLENLGRMLQRMIGQDIKLQCRLADHLPMIHVDAGMLDQVIMNLAVNSRDAMPAGGELHLTTGVKHFTNAQLAEHPEARAGQFVRLSVTDTGTGITPENLSRIFEPFFTTKEIGKGTGLGLSTVFGIVKQHQGWVEVNSTVGVGTTFHVYLPAREQVGGTQFITRKKFDTRGGNEVILLVEDDSAVRRVNRLFLKEAGYQLLEASSGNEALDIWKQNSNRIDLLLTDIMMPGGINGRVVAEKLVADKPGLKVVFMSGYVGDTPEGVEAFFKNGDSRFLKKPCSREEILGVLRDYLDGKNGHSEKAI